MLLDLEPEDRVAIVGRTGLGKTEDIVKPLLLQLMRDRIPVVAIDPKDELSVRGRPRDFTNVGPLPHRWTARQVAMAPEILEHTPLALAVVPDEISAKKSARAFELVAELLKALALEQRPRHVVLLAEETQWWAPYCPQLLHDVTTLWRDYKVTVVLVSQRVIGIPIEARAMLNQIVSFAQTEPADIEGIRRRTVLTDPTFHERIQRLRPREFEIWRAGQTPEVNRGEEQRTGGIGDEPGVGAEGSGGGGGSGGRPVGPGEHPVGAGGDVGEGRDHLVQSRSVLQAPAEGDLSVDEQRTTPELGLEPGAPRRTRKKKAPSPPPLTTPRKKSRRRRRPAA